MVLQLGVPELVDGPDRSEQSQPVRVVEEGHELEGEFVGRLRGPPPTAPIPGTIPACAGAGVVKVALFGSQGPLEQR
ncbi:hypothetical protein [Streptomyces sp. NPDC005141]